MTQLLASVSNVEEAKTAAKAGADVIDLKNPGDGALGAVTPAVLSEVSTALNGSHPISAVAGNLPMKPGPVIEAVLARAAADFVKIGLFPAQESETADVIAALEPMAGRIRLVAVLFADQDPDFGLIETLAQSGFAGVMLDTLVKESGGLTRHLPPARLADFVGRARSHGLMVGLAGSLELPDIARLAVLRPDYLGFRSALTNGARAEAIDAGKIAAVKAAIAQMATRTTPAADHAQAPSSDSCDRVFVTDFVLPLEIGAYAHEHGRRQDVRFSVEALVDRIPDNARGMADIYSYDIIIDAISALTEAGHTVLVEELATRLAATLLSDPRLRSVTVRVEKLGLGPGAVGVEIRRHSSKGP